MRPLMYGYLRVDLVGDEIDTWEERIGAFAEREGFDLGTVFREPGDRRGAFSALIHELQRAECRHVVVPDMAHIWGEGQARHALVSRLWSEANAGVWVAEPEANRIEVRVADRHPARHVQGRHTPSSGVDLAADEIRLAATRFAVPAARLQVRCILSRWQLVELQAPVERIVSELVSEAADLPSRDGDKPLLVRLRRDEHLTVELWDSRPAAARTASPVNPRVAALSTRHGRDQDTATGVRTWCELPLGVRT